ncbi:aspartyl-tRNA synthetase 2, mitochondrial [Cyanidiococcus yangmingshanensis]|uniref:Aspartyl-tRNA synthetase 2, mitochondrial n=1 Tax=Cyanidiococcus yangmingshanensis TaxID=2690220 RepID=A0A7J7IIF6_9RHOD|nr:aspartyl-tRNA synthetase 2, mitochondrial [Cyanidiococcus yangmingshanensis]
MERFGTDAPDLRFGVELQRVWSERATADPDTDAVLYEALGALAPLHNVESIRALVVPDAAGSTSRKTIDNYTQFVKNLGLSGLLWGKVGVTNGQPALSTWSIGKAGAFDCKTPAGATWCAPGWLSPCGSRPDPDRAGSSRSTSD